MGIAKVTTNYQVTIPKDIRKIQGINVGDTVLFAIEGNRVDFFKVRKEEIIKDVAGSWKIKESGPEYVKAIRQDWEKRRKRLNL